MAWVVGSKGILVPRAHNPSGLRQGLRALAGSKPGSPWITDFRYFYANSEVWNNNGCQWLQKCTFTATAHISELARALDPRTIVGSRDENGSKGLWPLPVFFFGGGGGGGSSGMLPRKLLKISASKGCIWCILGINSAPLRWSFFSSNSYYFPLVALLWKATKQVLANNVKCEKLSKWTFQ